MTTERQRTWVAQYVTTGTHEPVYRHDLIEAPDLHSARAAAQWGRRRYEAIVSVEPYQEEEAAE